MQGTWHVIIVLESPVCHITTFRLCVVPLGSPCIALGVCDLRGRCTSRDAVFFRYPLKARREITLLWYQKSVWGNSPSRPARCRARLTWQNAMRHDDCPDTENKRIS